MMADTVNTEQIQCGRPSKYAPEMAAEICERIAEGESLREICAGQDTPGKTTVLSWLKKHEEFRVQYARAREDQADHYAEEIIEIVDDATNDWIERQVGDGKTIMVLDR